MLLESPNPKDPQDAQVAAQMLEDPERFAAVAHEWAVKYAGAPKQDLPTGNYKKQPVVPKKQDDPSRYDLFNKPFTVRCGRY